MCCLMSPLFPLLRSSSLLPPPLIFCQNSIAHCCPLALTLLQVPLVLLPLMVLCLRLLPAVLPSSPPPPTGVIPWSCYSRPAPRVGHTRGRCCYCSVRWYLRMPVKMHGYITSLFGLLGMRAGIVLSDRLGA
jgi:hypothetical protein